MIWLVIILNFLVAAILINVVKIRKMLHKSRVHLDFKIGPVTKK